MQQPEGASLSFPALYYPQKNLSNTWHINTSDGESPEDKDTWKMLMRPFLSLLLLWKMRRTGPYGLQRLPKGPRPYLRASPHQPNVQFVVFIKFKMLFIASLRLHCQWQHSHHYIELNSAGSFQQKEFQILHSIITITEQQPSEFYPLTDKPSCNWTDM